MNRVVGIETEYGCLVGGDHGHGSPDAWPSRVKNYLFKKGAAGVLDLHYRDYEEPPGNGGFLLNGGRLYIDMGHLEYSSPECRTVRDSVAYDAAGDLLLQSALEGLGAAKNVSFIKNNIDHVTGATFGCHENYLMRRDLQFNPRILGTLLSFLATRQIFTGTGRVGQASPLAFDFELPRSGQPVEFQISQRADHIVNDIYQWVQFNRAIINARDEPLADFRRYRRLHLLIGDSNMSPFAAALKIGTTACVLTLLEESCLPEDVILHDAVIATRQISHEGTGPRRSAAGRRPHPQCARYSGRLSRARRDPSPRPRRGDRLAARHLVFHPARARAPIPNCWSAASIGSRRSSCSRPSAKTKASPGRTHGCKASISSIITSIRPRASSSRSSRAEPIASFNASVRRPECTHQPPADTRAHGRGRAVALLQKQPMPYVINWDSITLENLNHLPMPDPFETYDSEATALVE